MHGFTKALALDVARKGVKFSGANNGIYIITEKKSSIPVNSKTLTFENRVLYELSPDKQPIRGNSYRHNRFTNHALRLQEGDMVYMFSDGLADQFGGPNGKKFKYLQFKELLLEIFNLPAAVQKSAIDKRFETWKGTLEQVDDVCVIGIRI